MDDIFLRAQKLIDTIALHRGSIRWDKYAIVYDAKKQRWAYCDTTGPIYYRDTLPEIIEAAIG